MDKRYQVFISSTYADLKEERQKVIQALMEMDCIPAGMELFPAADEEQWQFIKKVIDDCDYYLLIIGGRYGSTTPNGISYTEQEFDYAARKGLKIIALIHGEPQDIPFGKSEADPIVRDKLIGFRKKVMDGRLVKFWKTAEELPGLVALSLQKALKSYPAVGWVRADRVSDTELLAGSNQPYKANGKIAKPSTDDNLSTLSDTADIADIDDKYTIHGNYEYDNGEYVEVISWKHSISWRDIFSIISPYILGGLDSISVKQCIINTFSDDQFISGKNQTISEYDFMTITIQLRAYGLIDTKQSTNHNRDGNISWHLTAKGEKLMLESRIIKKDQHQE